MYEECHSTPQLTHLLHVVVAHQTIFRPYRDHFVPYMVNSLNRGLPPNQPENRALSIAAADLILSWEQHHLSIKNLTPKDDKQEASVSNIVEQSEASPNTVKQSKNNEGKSSAKAKGFVESSESHSKGDGTFQLNQTLVRR